MVTRIMQQITQGKKNFCQKLWRYTISGNMIELSVSAHYLNEPEMYRKSVIRIGFILSEIERLAGEYGKSVQIHTFPSMLDSRLIASAELKPAKRSATTAPDTTETVTAEVVFDSVGQTVTLTEPAYALTERIKTIAGSYGLTMTPINCEDLLQIESNISPSLLGKVENCGQSFAISSSNDNPFIWLKTGLCLNRVEQTIDCQSPELSPDFHINISNEMREGSKDLIPENTFLQAIFFACRPMLMY
jgi:hypothetical protein